MATTPALDYLLGTYFHQDFYVDHGGVPETVDAFVRDDPEQAPSVPREIWDVLGAMNDDQLAEYVRGTGCVYRPNADEGGYRGWLEQVARRIQDSL